MGSSVRRKYETLDALRGVAAILVVLFHISHAIGVVVPNGYLAVDMFFVLSGFVIAHSYDDRLSGRGGWKILARARIIRFWPLVVLAAIICLLKALASEIVDSASGLPISIETSAIFASVFLLPLPVGGDNYLFPANVPLWTLALELYLSAAFALLFPLFVRRGLALTLLVSGIWLAALIANFGSNDLGASVSTFWGGVARASFGFLFGVVLCRSNIRLSVGPVLPVMLLVLFLAWPVPDEVRMIYDMAFVFVASPLIVMLGASSEPQGAQLRVAHYLGAISFSLYMLHGPIQGGIFAAGRVLGISPLSLAIVSLVVLLILCPLVDRLYDQPVRKFLRRILNSAEGARAPAG
ncbi:acyltransferase [Devosia sp. FJ2-5-3]|uniref:acyltransferase family protein n=1 Tax=Devosia sp. FJ2-5-3 TaxID=2976680 RepID=UPI0023D892C2|nr:acyltransferase [Devosia sp. FJ2-5-3]WEJ59132.1 acyltransferase [Devosia sp. FJ2-5-3]